MRIIHNKGGSTCCRVIAEVSPGEHGPATALGTRLNHLWYRHYNLTGIKNAIHIVITQLYFRSVNDVLYRYLVWITITWLKPIFRRHLKYSALGNICCVGYRIDGTAIT